MYAALRPVALASLVLFTGGLAAPARLAAADKRPMKIEDLYKFKRVAAPQISPDGRRVVYQVGTVDLDANKSTTALWVAATDGKTPPKQLTDPKGKRDAAPRWSPDGTKILFESSRSGSSQLWVVPADGGEPKQLTDISTGASGGQWSPDGTHVAFVSSVFAEFSEKPFAESDKLNKAKDEEIEKSPVKAKVFTKLFYRHWDEYVGDKRQHLFVITADGKDCRDVTPGERDANPTSSTFSSGDDFTFTPDSKHLVFTAVPEKDEAWSTNYELCRVSITNTSPKWETLTTANKAADSGPKFSPDGKKLAWRAQKKAGYEADLWSVVVATVKPDGSVTGLDPAYAYANSVDASVNEFLWAGDRIMGTADHQGVSTVFSLPTKVAMAAKPSIVLGYFDVPGSKSSLSYSVETGGFALLSASITAPPEVYAVFNDIDRAAVKVSKANDTLLAELDLPKPESVKVKIEDGEMQMWVLKPPGFDPKKKWPVVYLVHGGPQGAWEDGWSYRWNPSLWAARGYVVALPNPRGSTGFGQKFVDEITGDWGGKCYRDLVAGLDYVEKLPYVDKDRIASAGASFGGYMMNWFAVNDIAPRFKCLITHCSVWNFESMWGTTDELWFDEWEHGGLPWEKPGKYAEFSPHKKAGNLGKHKTPMLVIHNDLDFRCPIGQGHELFSALQRQGVPSRMVNFPDEGHWVLKPKNGAYWHNEVFGWLAKYAPPGGK
ncbi:peptidase s9 : Dipeptidyl aminopeptidase/acylaminoacyl peptidase OS=Singulisphaera acidiphila (strain ATCC BAA-1392 / DSM 18658 / VKM B-2454 / MOB10) GN=Sinac_5836 PE=4 SV=1: PD40: PD40: Peptidase_S9 [Gemmataceae bacterium]|nr:peptidase s9 : Dipeptidyl aminopeptidase/acylaminoacyl peptidase OS=Singulisphaera acidiphila (strain ATCC BAA-1392 / DSM 18658 / VKM B-2454 / MOB10) GN=Sinac_5836 PE=4 SV=1: PD40: PD40: Peptidase_S9 [Gemmataceae bacterium]VTT97315.1 peptidase s9 : Dipeptidyl aminopeptidase/acylaminoacyl peptidase OS=Singulisphaera acidiphila (strain ATCC BAA-1392 / DSM 18658 / VKM B-2454 / MOB10) GN=Sinac_5836 PE=4 SV=1: PD40: PD40: Peptidase_S9 [Gemmataceae bacterium]